MMSPRGEVAAEKVATNERAAASALPGSPVTVKQEALSPQGKTFQEGQQVSFVKVGKNGWTLVRDRSGQQCWLATQHLNFSPELNTSEATHVAPDKEVISPDVNSPDVVKHPTNAVVGIALGLGEKNAVVVAGVKPGAPAHRSRMIAPGDQLVRVDGKLVNAGMELKSVVQLLCGPVGSIVSLGVMKESGDELDVVLVREQPATTVYSSLSHAPESPAESTAASDGLAIRPVQPDSIQPRDGPIHNLYSSQASLPPNAVEHGRFSPHYRQHEDGGMSGALSRMTLSNAESASGVVYRAGPSPQQQIDLGGPAIMPVGSEDFPKMHHESMDLLPLQPLLAMPEQRLQAAAAMVSACSHQPRMMQDMPTHQLARQMPERASPNNVPAAAVPAMPTAPVQPYPFAVQGAHAPRLPDGLSEIGMTNTGYDCMLNPFVGDFPEMQGFTELGMTNSGLGQYHNPFRMQLQGYAGGALTAGSPGTPDERMQWAKHPWSPTMANNELGNVVPVGLERYGSPFASRRSVPGSHSDWAGFMSPFSRAP